MCTTIYLCETAHVQHRILNQWDHSILPSEAKLAILPVGFGGVSRIVFRSFMSLMLWIKIDSSKQTISLCKNKKHNLLWRGRNGPLTRSPYGLMVGLWPCSNSPHCGGGGSSQCHTNRFTLWSHFNQFLLYKPEPTFYPYAFFPDVKRFQNCLLFWNGLCRTQLYVWPWKKIN